MNNKMKTTKFGTRDSGFGIRQETAKTLLPASSRIPSPETRNPFLAARGLTLIELMVASAIIVILILAVGTVLSGLGLLVRVSQSAIRVNAKASAISTILHQDTRRATQGGFICITQASLDGSPQLFVLNLGSTPSTTGSARDNGPVTGTPGGFETGGVGTPGNYYTSGNGALACLGQCDNTGLGSILWHATWVINPAASQNADSNLSDSATPAVNVYGAPASVTSRFLKDPREYQCLNRWDCNTVIAAFQTAKSFGTPALYTLPATVVTANTPAPVTLPPGYYNSANALNDLNNLWKILSIYGSELSIQWTDGTTVTNSATGLSTLQWYGINYNPGASYVDTTVTPNITVPTGWYAYSKSNGYVISPNTLPPDVTTYNNSTGALPTEFTFTSGGASGKYRALFCHSDSATVWPTAIKIRFNLADPDAPKEFDTGNSSAWPAYDETATYGSGAMVQYGGRTYRCISANGPASVQVPTNTTYWCLSGTYYEVICPIAQ